MIFGIFTSHGSFASSAVQAAEEIIGKQDNYLCISNANLSIDEIKNKIEQAVINYRADAYFIFIDFYGSSFSLPAMKLARDYDSLTLMFGFNLPVIIDFFSHRKSKSPDELLIKLKHIGKEAVR